MSNSNTRFHPLVKVGTTAKPKVSVEPTLPPLNDVMFFCLGTFGHLVGAILTGLYEAVGMMPPILVFDGSSENPTTIFNGKAAQVPAHLVFTLPIGETLSELGKELTNRERAALSGWSNVEVFRSHSNAAGTGGIRKLTVLALDKFALPVYRFILGHVRNIGKGTVAYAGGSDLQMIRDRLSAVQEDIAVKVIIIFGGCGGVGSALAVYLPYLIKRAFKNAPGVKLDGIWGIMCGPNAFKSLTAYITENYDATKRDLVRKALDGIAHRFGGGISIYDRRPGYDNIILQDDESIPADGCKPTDHELTTFATKTAKLAQTLADPALMPHLTARLVDPGPQAKDLSKPRLPWFVVPGMSEGGYSNALAEEYATAVLNLQALQTLHDHISGNGTDPAHSAEKASPDTKPEVKNEQV